MKVMVTIHSVSGLKDMDGLWGKTDPYVALSYGSSSWHTATQKDAGSEAAFEESWTFETEEDLLSEVKIKVRDNRTMMLDGVLAEGAIGFEQTAGYHFSGEIGLINKDHGHEPVLKFTLKCQ
ncbi:C2 domain protein [Gregarina niphandrodes]|uniref:C2 domain protein n=1 Tax=Gregarina niphandrodes TaxID=110365 RepID=A0A023B3R4_GRENI|nr:C2 domain protein [Gregarina niphandrodes]EZG55891.1 C2 domain protein [Gregarina niphandrodes]|eukprot:XP_011131427.1 C2 domain protein [Gregarina niphandrodes]